MPRCLLLVWFAGRPLSHNIPDRPSKIPHPPTPPPPPPLAQDAKNAAARKAGQPLAFAKKDVADFANDFYHEHWDIEHVGLPESGACCAGGRGRWWWWSWWWLW